MSTSVVLAVMRQFKILSAPTGQLILAGSVLDDILTLILLSELKALTKGGVVNIVVPIISSLGYLLVVGYIAVRWWPPFVRKVLLPRIPKKHKSTVLLTLVLGMAAGLGTALYASRASR
jgi:Kef-type K+ transport system membrane component KefB